MYFDASAGLGLSGPTPFSFTMLNGPINEGINWNMTAGGVVGISIDGPIFTLDYVTSKLRTPTNTTDVQMSPIIILGLQKTQSVGVTISLESLIKIYKGGISK